MSHTVTCDNNLLVMAMAMQFCTYYILHMKPFTFEMILKILSIQILTVWVFLSVLRQHLLPTTSDYKNYAGKKTSSPIVAKKCTFFAYEQIMINRPAERPSNQ